MELRNSALNLISSSRSGTNGIRVQAFLVGSYQLVSELVDVIKYTQLSLVSFLSFRVFLKFGRLVVSSKYPSCLVLCVLPCQILSLGNCANLNLVAGFFLFLVSCSLIRYILAVYVCLIRTLWLSKSLLHRVLLSFVAVRSLVLASNLECRISLLSLCLFVSSRLGSKKKLRPNLFCNFWKP